MSIAEETTRRLAVLRQAAQDFFQMVNLIDGNFDGRLGEIKNLELKRDQIKSEVEESSRKASGILQDASEKCAAMNKESNSLMTDAQALRLQAKSDMEEALKVKAEAQALLNQANQKQREADLAWHQVEERKKKILEAVK